MPKLKSDKLSLLEKLVQSSSEGETTTEQKDLFVNLVKETNSKSPKMRKKSANSSDRQSRQRVKVIRENSHEIKDQNHGKVTIPLPGNEQRSKSGSSRSSSGSSSSFWSTGSQDRGKMVRKSSRSSRSYSSRSRSRSSSYSSKSSSRSRSRSPPVYSTNKSRKRSKSPLTPKPPEPRSRSMSSSQSAPVNSSIQRHHIVINETSSEYGRKGKHKKLLKRGQVKKSRSMDINPDVFIEEKIKQKYKELNRLLAGQYAGSSAQLDSQQFQQMQTLRSQYVKVSHGLPPSGVLVPRSLPANLRVKSGGPQGLTKFRSRSRDTLYSTASDLGDDHYGSVQRVMNLSAARDGKVIVDPQPVMMKKKKKKVKKADSETKLNSTFDSTSDHTGSRTLSPRSRLNDPELHHLKESKNPDLLKWLKQKDKDHRKKEKEERRKKREEREKLILEANEKFERRMESKKIVDKWMVEKQKEHHVELKEKRRQEKQEKLQQKIKTELSFPGNSMTVRPQTAPTDWKRKSYNVDTYKTKNSKVKNNENGDEKPLTVQDQLGTSSQLKVDLNEQGDNDQLPHTSKFMYKRPVAGKIKLKMQNRPMSAQPKLQSTTQNNSSRSVKEDKENKNLRMSHEEWVKSKHKEDQDKQKQEQIRQKENLSKSDPELAKIVPDIAKKRIHNMLNERKSIDTGIKRYDTAVNRSFGGGSFDGSKSPKSPSKGHSYKLSNDRPSTSKEKSGDTLKVAGKSYQRPGTAPAGRRVPMPMKSPCSPVPAMGPARVEEVMNSEDQSNSFKLPFPPGEGMPKHVADMQKKLFSEQVIRKSEERESQEQERSMALVPCSELAEGRTSSAEDIKYDNIRAIEHSSEQKTDETQYLNSDTEITGTKPEDKPGEQDKKEEKIIEVKTEEAEEIKEEDSSKELDSSKEEEKMKENLDTHLNLQQDTENDKTEQAQGYDEVDTSRDQSQDEENSDEKIVDGNSNDETKEDNELGQSNKHVSFCEETEVFVDHDRQEWSTDTGTPDEDNSRYTTREDLSKLIDSCGELLDKQYGDPTNEDREGDDKAFITGSLDDDF